MTDCTFNGCLTSFARQDGTSETWAKGDVQAPNDAYTERLKQRGILVCNGCTPTSLTFVPTVTLQTGKTKVMLRTIVTHKQTNVSKTIDIVSPVIDGTDSVWSGTTAADIGTALFLLTARNLSLYNETVATFVEIDKLDASIKISGRGDDFTTDINFNIAKIPHDIKFSIVPSADLPSDTIDYVAAQWGEEKTIHTCIIKFISQNTQVKTMKYLIYILSALAFSVTAQAANLTESAQWENGIYRIELSDPVQGGENGIDNRQAKQLGNRTLYLKQQLESANAVIATNTSQISSVDSRINTNTTDISALNSRVNTHTSQLSTLDDRINTNTNKLSTHDDILVTQQSADVNLTNLVSLLTARVVALENQTPTVTTVEAIKVGQVVEFDRHFANAADVTAHMGYGTWERFAQGRVTVGISTNASDPPNIQTLGSEFGNYFHTLTVAQMPRHNHVQSTKYKYYVASATGIADGSTGSADTNDSGDEILVNKVDFSLAEPAHVGGNEQFRLSQPSRIVDKWKRVS